MIVCCDTLQISAASPVVKTVFISSSLKARATSGHRTPLTYVSSSWDSRSTHSRYTPGTG
jgi:hypothetical protein